MELKREDVEELIKKAAQTVSAEDAVHFSQAALNAANALLLLKELKWKMQQKWEK